MNEVHLVEAVLDIEFDLIGTNSSEYAQEYEILGEGDDDAIGQWLRVAKAKGETSESDPVILHLIVELYRKLDRLEQIVTNTTPTHIPLSSKKLVNRIGFEHFEISEPLLREGEGYYGRITLPLQNRRVVPVYFQALSPRLAKMTQIHPSDEKEWDSYMMSRERKKIRKLKGNE